MELVPQQTVLFKQFFTRNHASLILCLISMEMYKTVDSAKLFTTTFTPDKFTHLFSSSQATVRSLHIKYLLWESIVHIGREFATTFSSPPNVVARRGGVTGTHYTQLLYARTPISPIWVPRLNGIVVSQYQFNFCKWADSAALEHVLSDFLPVNNSFHLWQHKVILHWFRLHWPGLGSLTPLISSKTSFYYNRHPSYA